ncbi:MAG: lipocalin family protein [Deltaproteobacteria bacterium]|nr:lipocalin family protein [Deltaproteobacteria bacterium]
MRLSSLVGAALLCSALIGGTALANKKLIGVWQADRLEHQGQARKVPPGMKMTATFKKKGGFVAEMTRGDQTKREQGSWTARGKTLTTVIKGKTEVVTFEPSGKELKLIKPAGTLIMKRVK